MTFKTQQIVANKTFSLSTIGSKVTWAILLALADWHRSCFVRDEDDASEEFDVSFCLKVKSYLS